MKAVPYKNYKPANAAWLSGLPDAWTQIRGRFVMAVNPPVRRARLLDETDEVSFVPMEAVGEYGGLDLERTKPLDEIGAGYTAFEEGDVVVAKITPCFENGKGAIAHGLKNGVGFGTTELHVLRTGRRLDGQFLFYLTISHTFRMLGESEMYGAGGQKRVPPEFAKDFRVPLPPLDEQQTIARFLDAKTAQIDALVTKKRQLIAKLKEKRSALIARTVTRGLPPEAAKAAGLEPNPEMKNSGVDWLGEIPAHWGAAQLRRYVKFITSGSRGWAEHYSDTGSIFVRIGNLTRGSLTIDLSDIQYVAPPPGTEGERTKIKAGDLLFSITAYLGSIAVAPEALQDAFVSQHIALVRLVPNSFVPIYAGYCVLADAGQAQLNEQGYGGTKIQLSLDDVKTLWLPRPPIAEQQAIATYLDHETAQLDQLVDKVEAAITRLTEYRQALITSAVTGKIDVRGCRHAREGGHPEEVAHALA